MSSGIIAIIIIAAFVSIVTVVSSSVSSRKANRLMEEEQAKLNSLGNRLNGI